MDVLKQYSAALIDEVKRLERVLERVTEDNERLLSRLKTPPILDPFKAAPPPKDGGSAKLKLRSFNIGKEYQSGMLVEVLSDKAAPLYCPGSSWTIGRG